MAKNRDSRLSEIIKRVTACFANEDRKDELFRQVLVTNEVGDWAKFLTHDPVLNPGARPVGDKIEETMAAGQAIVMIFSLALAREINIAEALEAGLKNWEDADWRKRKAKKTADSSNEVEGIGACPGRAIGKAYVVSRKNPIEKFPNGWLIVASSASPELAMYFERASAIVTDHGGKTSHAANIARGRNLPCIVGTGNATERIPHGAEVELSSDAQTEKGTVTILKRRLA